MFTLPWSRKSRSESFADIARRQRLKRRLFWVLGVVLGLPVLLVFGLFLWFFITDPGRKISSDVLTTGRPDLIYSELHGIPFEQVDATRAPDPQKDNPFYVPKDSASIAETTLPKVAPDLKFAAKAWVSTQNSNNPGMFIGHDVDTYGNLYLIPGIWWYRLSVDDQTKLMDILGKHWRTYLTSAFGPFDSLAKNSTTPAQSLPGIIMFDTKGEVARNLGGYIRILRKPEI